MCGEGRHMPVKPKLESLRALELAQLQLRVTLTSSSSSSQP